MLHTLSAIAFIFGGCCSNVLTLEGIIGPQTSSIGNILTFCQFSFAALEGLFSFLSFNSGRPCLKPRKVPLRVYALAVLLYFTSSVTNNSVFQFGISVPLHIVFRCSGTVVTMIICWLFTGKCYSSTQVFSAFLLTIGAIITSLFRNDDISWESIASFQQGGVSLTNVNNRFLAGLLMLIISTVASSTLSVYSEWSYKTYGNHWKENMFYTHALALPLFLLRSNQLKEEYLALRYAQKQTSFRLLHLTIPLSKAHLLLANIITQQICVKGVNLLACHTNALTLSVVLLVRKFVSLIMSVCLFGGDFSTTCYVGIATVFVGAILYILAPTHSNSSRKTKDI